jgi:hypothetical protein
MDFGSIPTTVFAKNSSSKNANKNITAAGGRIILRNDKIVQIPDLVSCLHSVKVSKISYHQSNTLPLKVKH